MPVNVSILAQYGVEIKKARTEEEYFNSDDEPDEPPAYQPKPGSPGPGNTLGTYVYLRDATKKEQKTLFQAFWSQYWNMGVYFVC